MKFFVRQMKSTLVFSYIGAVFQIEFNFSSLGALSVSFSWLQGRRFRLEFGVSLPKIDKFSCKTFYNDVKTRGD